MWLAVHYRRLQALMLLALSALITVCAVFAPLYDRAMQQALTHLTVNAAPISATAIQIRSFSRFTPGVDAPSYAPALQDDLADWLPRAVRPWFLPRIDASSLLVIQADLTSTSPVGELLWRDGACAHVLWTAGGCPRASGDIAVSAADQRNFALNVGSTIEVREQPQVQQDRRLPGVSLRVTGIYRQIPGEYWDERLLAGLSGSLDPQPPNQPFHDTWLTARETFSGSRTAQWLDPLNSVTFNLNRDTVGVDRALRLGPLVSRLTNQAALRVDDSGASINAPNTVLADVQSGLPDISASINDGRRQALVTVPLLMIQLGLLALFVLGLVLGVAVEQRRPEVALARLRGSGRKGARRLVVAELLPVVLTGVPLGVAGALGLAAVARHTVLHDAAPFELGVGFWTAIAGAAALLSALTWGIAARGTRDDISLLLRSVPTRIHGWGLGVTDAVVVAGSSTAVLAFVTGGLRGPLALAAPALLALAVGLLLAHLIVPIAASLGQRLMLRGSYAPALAMLATARQPATRRVVAVITVASALLVFSTYAITVGSRNRQLAAQRENGSAMVADLTGKDLSRVESALATVADGHETPVVRMAPTGEAYRTTLAVVSEGFGRIALFPDSDPERVPWSRLQLATGRRLSITGQAISFLATPDRFSVSESSTSLQLEILSADGNTSVDLGPIPTARARTMSAAVSCASVCTVVGLSVRAYPGVRYGGHLTISDVKVTGGSTNLPGTAADWRPGVTDLNRFEPSADGPDALTVHLVNDGQDALGMTSRWFPTALPAVVAGPGTDPAVRNVNGNGLDAADRTLVSVARLPRAPGVDGAAVMVDLDLLAHWGPRIANSSRIQVWFDSESPSRLARVRAALQRNGVEISDVRRVSDVRRSYETSVPAWSLQLGVLVAIVGLLIAALVLVLLVASTWRRRSRDLACLGMSGVPTRDLNRISIGERLPIVVLAVLAGAGCGLLGAGFALPTVPLFARARPPSSLDLSTPWTSVLAVLAVELIVLGLVAWLCGSAVVSRARLSRVQEAP
jgi:putative ABC transport system permease protein